MSSQTFRAEGYLGPEFNAFLFAPINIDRRGGQLSVISALARLDLDAWAEAASLSRLPRDLAADKLSVLLGKATEVPLAAKDTQKIAGRLVALLPDQGRIGAHIFERNNSGKLLASVGFVTLVLALLIALMIGVMALLLSSGIAPQRALPTPQTPTASAINNVLP